MHKQKRDVTERAYTHGYQKGVNRKSKDLCPHQSKETRTAWLNGWRTGREDQWDGMSGTAGVGRNPMT